MPRPRHGPAGFLIAGLDDLVARRLGIVTFSDAPECVFRIAIARSRHAATLADGIRLAPGDRYLELHLDNRRVPGMAGTGPDLRWAISFGRDAVFSFRELARFLARRSDLEDIQAIRGEMVFLAETGDARAHHLLDYLGFTTRPKRASPWWTTHWRDFWDNLFAWAVLWTYSPASLRMRDIFTTRRFELWMSRALLTRRYGAGA